MESQSKRPICPVCDSHLRPLSADEHDGRYFYECPKDGLMYALTRPPRADEFGEMLAAAPAKPAGQSAYGTRIASTQ